MELWWSSWYHLVGVLEKLVELAVILDLWWNIGGTCCGVGESGVILVGLGGILVKLGGILVIFGEILLELWVYGGACWCIEIIGWSIYWIYSRLFSVLLQNILGGGQKNKFSQPDYG